MIHLIPYIKPVPMEPEAWVSFRGDTQYKLDRYHAVFARGVTFCGRAYATEAVKDTARTLPTRRCAGCQTRIRLPYLIPHELTNLRRKVQKFGGPA